MSKKKKVKATPEASYENFASMLAAKLKHLGKVECESFEDGSGMWVELAIEDTTLAFSFNPKGNQIDYVRLFKDKISVDQVKVWGTK